MASYVIYLAHLSQILHTVGSAILKPTCGYKKNGGRFFTAHTNLVSYTLVGDWFLYFLVL